LVTLIFLPMTDNYSTKFKFDLLSAFIAGMGLCLVFIFFVYKTSTIADIQNERTLVFCDFAVGLGLAYFLYKYLLPALSGQTILELTKEKIIDHVNNRAVTWKNVKAIRKVRFGKSSGIAIELFDKTELTDYLDFIQKPLCYIEDIFYGTPLIIAFQYVSGSNTEIFSAIENYFMRKNDG
jgi:hypothetical protein